MAIDDNTLYGLTGAQVKDLAQRISAGGGPTVVQTTGQSTTDVMSQKSVTDALANKASTNVATTSANGLMSTADKSKLDRIQYQGTGDVGHTTPGFTPYARYIGNDQSGDGRYTYVRYTGHSNISSAFLGGYTQEPDAGWWATERELAFKDEMPTITMTTTDPGEGAPLAANQFIGVYQ